MKSLIDKFFVKKQEINESNETQNEFSIYFDQYSEIKKEWELIRKIEDDSEFLALFEALERKHPRILDMAYFDFEAQVSLRTLKAMCKLLKK